MDNKLKKQVQFIIDKGWVRKNDLPLFRKVSSNLKYNIKLDEETTHKLRKAICLYYLDKGLDYSISKQEIKYPLKPNIKLKNHQIRDVYRIEQLKGRALIGEGLGSGKTLTSLTYAFKNQRLPMLIITPASVKYNWKIEIEKFIDYKGKVFVIDSNKWDKDLYEEDLTNSVFIINYDLVNKWEKFLESIPFKIAILDEVHKIKSYKAVKTKKVRGLCRKIPQVLALSGTPMPNRIIELFTPLNIVRPDLYPDYYQFGYKYHTKQCYPEEWNTNRSRTRDLDKLYVEMKENLLIRSEVKLDIPDKNRIFVSFDVKLGDNYEQARQEYRELHNITNRKMSNIEEDIKRLYGFMKGVAVQARKKASYAWIKDKVEPLDKVVIFCWYHEVLNELKALFKEEEVVTVSGEVSAKKRQDLIDKFQKDDSVRVCLATIGACAEGITLTSAHNLIFMETTYVPGLVQQAEARICRISQTKEQNIYYLISKNTVEEDIMDTLDNKQIGINLALDGKFTKDKELWGRNIK